MARKYPGKAESVDADRPKGEMSLAQNAMAFAVAGLIAAGVGGLQGYMTARPDAAATAPGAAKPADDSKKAPTQDISLIDLPAVVTNLAQPTDVWVRLEATLLFEGKTPPRAEALAGEISGDILAYLRTETLAQIQGVAGLQHLRQDLSERAATRSDGRVRELIIKALVVQ